MLIELDTKEALHPLIRGDSGLWVLSKGSEEALKDLSRGGAGNESNKKKGVIEFKE